LLSPGTFRGGMLPSPSGVVPSPRAITAPTPLQKLEEQDALEGLALIKSLSSIIPVEGAELIPPHLESAIVTCNNAMQ